MNDPPWLLGTAAWIVSSVVVRSQGHWIEPDGRSEGDCGKGDEGADGTMASSQTSGSRLERNWRTFGVIQLMRMDREVVRLFPLSCASSRGGLSWYC